MSTDDGWAMRTQDAEVRSGERVREQPPPGPPGRLARLASLPAILRRATPGPILVRGTVYASGLLALLVAWPSDIVGSQLVLALVGVAVLPVLFPRTMLVTFVLLACVGGWLLSTMVFGEPVTYPRLILLAAGMYLLHTLAALAALLPYDAILAPDVLGRWLLRAGIVIAITAVLAVVAIVVPGYLGDRRYLVASLVGLLMMTALAGYLASLVRRRG